MKNRHSNNAGVCPQKEDMALLEKNKAEYAQLQREFRHMELNRKSFADESQQVLRRQQATIAKLRKENDALKSELGLETRRQTARQSAVDEIAKQQDELERLRMLEEEEARRMHELDAKIASLESQISRKRKETGGVNAARENQAMVQKQIKILENRLDQALVKFNQALAKNKELREEIDDLRRERVVFDNIYRKLEGELSERKRQMANVIEQSNAAYERRDAFQVEIAAIEQANRKEQDDFEAQMLELSRILDEELVLPHVPVVLTSNAYSSSSRKNLRVADRKETVLMLPGGGAARSASSSRASLTTTATSSSSTQNNNSSCFLSERQELAMSEERVQNFEEAFNRIKQATGITQIDELVRIFIKNEDQNFSLFNYVNEQTNEIEKLEEQVQQLRDEEQKYNQESGEDQDQHKIVLQDLHEKLRAAETQASRYESKCEDHQTIIDSLKLAIASCFTKTECPRPTELQGDSTVTEANMLQYLAIIEKKCNKLIKQYCALKASHAEYSAKASSGEDQEFVVPPSSAAPAILLGVGPTTPMGQDLVQINPPKLDDYSSEEDEAEDDAETRPLTRDELKARTLSRMHRRGLSTAGATRSANRGGGGAPAGSRRCCSAKRSK